MANDKFLREWHDLKSPLASLSSIVTTLKNNIDNKEFRDAILSKLEGRCDFLLSEVDRVFEKINEEIKK